MSSLSSLLVVALAIVSFYSVSTVVVTYTATFEACVQGLTCPEGNPSRFNHTFALNGTLSPNVTLQVGDVLRFDLETNVPIHPLTICRNSPIPKFCQDANGTDVLNIPITKAGDSTVAVFTRPGTFYYGCNYHPGMGAFVNVTRPTSLRKLFQHV
ncbi:unnamed protein product [Adineta ricciae]|uniref:Uncharacterized protein n=1 Tax=Adineta ricciae TaxID=249248 RepID=A0A814CY38_ADIRI|nr:unnamed protein product [Adineta ricciae]CAF1334847.1 unnamed protein product [Adineta ricciae]